MSSSEGENSSIQRGISTLSIHSNNPDDWNCRPMALPLVTSSNFKYQDIEQDPHFFYGRYGNPTRECVEKTVAAMEGAKYGMCFPSGMTAFTACMQLLKPGDGIVCAHVVYGGVLQYLEDETESRGLETTFVDLIQCVDNIRPALKKNTKMVWLEVCTNPSLRIIDIEPVCKIISEYNPNIIIVVDNTFLTPCLVKPLDLGAHIVMHSMTKFMSGHGDIIMGCLSTSRKDLHKPLNYTQKYLGFAASPFDCYLMSRSLKTLPIRMRQHEINATAVAKFLEGHPAVEKVWYPGLPSHPDHEKAARILSGFGGMVSLNLKGGIAESKCFLKSLKLITYAVSLGSTESLVCLPWLTSHGMLPEKLRIEKGVTETLVRFSIGLEDVEDIIQDLSQALQKL